MEERAIKVGLVNQTSIAEKNTVIQAEKLGFKVDGIRAVGLSKSYKSKGHSV